MMGISQEDYDAYQRRVDKVVDLQRELAATPWWRFRRRRELQDDIRGRSAVAISQAQIDGWATR